MGCPQPLRTSGCFSLMVLFKAQYESQEWTLVENSATGVYRPEFNALSATSKFYGFGQDT